MMIHLIITHPRDYSRKISDTPLMRALTWKMAGYKLLAWEADSTAEVLALKVSNYRQREDIFNGRAFVGRWGQFNSLWENFYMPTRSRNNKPTRSEQPFATKGFLERRLSDGEILELDAWKPKPIEIFDHMAGMTHEGLKITLTYKADTGSGICTLTDNRPTSPTEGYALSSFDTDCLQALKMAIYKHTAILAGDWTSLLTLPIPSRRG